MQLTSIHVHMVLVVLPLTILLPVHKIIYNSPGQKSNLEEKKEGKKGKKEEKKKEKKKN